MPPIRSPWKDGDAAQALIVRDESAVKSHPRYRGAKAGSEVDAWALVADLLPKADAALRARMSGADVILPVHALEGASVNRIPAAAAAWLSERFGLPVARQVVQVNRA